MQGETYSGQGAAHSTAQKLHVLEYKHMNKKHFTPGNQMPLPMFGGLASGVPLPNQELMFEF